MGELCINFEYHPLGIEFVKILIAGASGLIGQALVAAWQNQHDIVVLGRDADKLKKMFPQRPGITWAQLQSVEGVDVIINLAGANIGQGRWTAKRKQVILDSRVTATQQLAALCAKASESPRLLNASAIGVYGLPATPQVFDEQSALPNPPQGFLAEVGAAWEGALSEAEQAGVPVTKMRFGVVLAKHGGALAKMLPAFKLGLGGPIGSGQQRFSWVALADIVRAIAFLVEHPELTGPVNIVAPEVVTQKHFSQVLGKALHRPAFFPLPAWLVKLQFGQMGEELLLNGVSVISQVLTDAQFTFAYPNLSAALQHVLTTRSKTYF